MSWARLDDKEAFAPWVLRVGNEAYGALNRARSYCGDHLTDGLLCDKAAQAIASAAIWKKLEGEGKLKQVDGGWEIVGWLTENPSREVVLDKRSKSAKKKADYRARVAESGQRQPSSEPHAEQQEPSKPAEHASCPTACPPVDKARTPADPTPTPNPIRERVCERAPARVAQPVPVSKESHTRPVNGKVRSRETGVPENFKANDAAYALGGKQGLEKAQVDEQAEMFVRHYRAKQSSFPDWTSKFEEWLLRRKEFRDQDRAGSGHCRIPVQPTDGGKTWKPKLTNDDLLKLGESK